jgi:hypothetical protein
MTESSRKYINDFLYLVVKPAKSRGDRTLLYCSGINYDRFYPITKGRHRACANPAMRGLQLSNFAIRALAISKGAVPKAIKENICAGTAPKKDSWYTERLLIENAYDSLPDEIIELGVLTLMKKFTNSLRLEEAPLETLPSPNELQNFLASLCDKYGRQ